MDIVDCISCYAYKKKETCAIDDDMHILYDAIQKADTIVIGSPEEKRGLNLYP